MHVDTSWSITLHYSVETEHLHQELMRFICAVFHRIYCALHLNPNQKILLTVTNDMNPNKTSDTNLNSITGQNFVKRNFERKAIIGHESLLISKTWNLCHNITRNCWVVVSGTIRAHDKPRGERVASCSTAQDCTTCIHTNRAAEKESRRLCFYSIEEHPTRT